MIEKLISLPISILLFIWMLRIKKDDPFPKGSVAKMLLTGALATVGATIVTVGLGLIVTLIRIGPTDLSAILSNPESEESAHILERIQSLSGTPTWRTAFVSAFITAAIPEECLKYLATRICLRKPGTVKTRMDAVVCAAIVGLGFQVIEDLTYAGDVATALMRAFMPFHFIFGAIMGYYYGQAVTTGQKSANAKALVFPILIHGLFDASIHSVQVSDAGLVFALIMMVLMLILTIFMIVKIHKWSHEGTLAEPIGNP